MSILQSLRHELQTADCEESPVHGDPPFDGGGWLHFLVRIILPPPHFLLHIPYLLQELQAPFTKINI